MGSDTFGIRLPGHLAPARILVEWAALAEAKGFDACWFPHDTFRKNSWAFLSGGGGGHRPRSGGEGSRSPERRRGRGRRSLPLDRADLPALRARAPRSAHDLPIYGGGWGPEFLRMTGEVCDGSLPMVTPPASLLMVAPIRRTRSG